MSKESNKVLYFVFTVIIIALIIISYFWGYKTSKKNITYNYINDTIVLSDTVIKTIYKKGKLKIIRDTLWINKEIIIKDSTRVASLDTLTSDSLLLNIDYYFPPINEFKIKYRLPPRITLISKEIIEKKNRLHFGIGGGLVFGTKGIDFGITIGAFYNF